MATSVTNVTIAGLGGQGVLKASDILSEVAFKAAGDVKKSEIHGMSQRGGSVNSDVRFGEKVFSPMVPDAGADYLVILDETQIENNRQRLAADGKLITVECIDVKSLPNRRSVNVALLGALSVHLDIAEELWLEAIKANLPEKLHDVNVQAFAIGRASQ